MRIDQKQLAYELFDSLGILKPLVKEYVFPVYASAHIIAATKCSEFKYVDKHMYGLLIKHGDLQGIPEYPHSYYKGPVSTCCEDFLTLNDYDKKNIIIGLMRTGKPRNACLEEASPVIKSFWNASISKGYAKALVEEGLKINTDWFKKNDYGDWLPCVRIIKGNPVAK